jgi:hypothetical protein
MANPDGPRDMKGTMSEFLEREGMRDLGELLRIKEAWVRIVGEDKAQASKPYRLEAGRLFIGVSSHAQVQNILFRSEEIKRAIKKEINIDIDSVTAKKINLR